MCLRAGLTDYVFKVSASAVIAVERAELCCRSNCQPIPPPGPCDFKESNVESLAAEVLRMALERLRGRKRELTQAAAQRLKSAHIRIGETGPVLSGGAFLIVRVREGVRT